MKQSVRVALCGIAAALSLALLFLTGLLPMATVALPAIAGCLLVAVVVEAGVAWGFASFCATAVLGFFLTPDREAFILYVVLLGYYPVLASPLSKIRTKPLRMVVKLLVFNAALGAGALAVVFLLGMPLAVFSFLGPFTIPVLWVLANGVFIVYDMALKGLAAAYMQRLHPHLARILKSG